MAAMVDYGTQLWSKARRFPRQKLETRLSVTSSRNQVGRGWCNDVSPGGLGATAALRLEAGEEVVLEFTVPTWEEVLTLRAIVRFVNGFRYGFEFLSLSAQQRQAITTYCEQKEQ
jgi:hypothetical protein